MINREAVEEEIHRIEIHGGSMEDIERLITLYELKAYLCGEGDTHRERYETHETHALSAEEAKHWVSGMIGTDPEHAHGGRWTMEEAQTLAQKIGWKLTDEEMPAFYAILNALYSDYAFVAKKYGVTQPEFYAELARAFLMDADARPGKAERYYRYIAQ